MSDLREERIESPWGEPSDVLRIGRMGRTRIVFLPRHGRGHAIPPSEINYRANIDVMKRAGVTDLVSLSACGSYKAELYPGLFVLVDQFVDRTSGRASSFFGRGCVAHVSVAHPVGPALQGLIAEAATAEGLPFVRGGTLVTARVNDADASRVEAILATYRPIDPVARGADYRKEGWTTFDPKAPAYRPNQAEIDRMRANWPG